MKLLGLLVALSIHAQAQDHNWSWNVQTYNNQDVYLGLSDNGHQQFTVLLGGGGCIQQINSAAGALMYDHPRNNYTADSVNQAILWCPGIQQPGIPGAPDPRWNINQAGNQAGTFTPIVAVNYSQSAQTVDIWSVPCMQWLSPLGQYFSGYCPMLCRYTLKPNGVLSIRRVFITPTNGYPSYSFLCESPCPLNTSFSRVVYHFNSNGAADNSWLAFPSPNSPASTREFTQQNGYAVAMGTKANIAWMGGTAAPDNQTSADISYVLQSGSITTTQQFVESSYELHINPATAGMVVDQTLEMIIRTPEADDMLDTINAEVPAIPPVSISTPTAPTAGTGASGIVQTLQHLAGTHAYYTNHLAPLLQIIQ